jgi:TonB family protein
MVLPLRVWTDEASDHATALQLAHTLDISPIGARLGGMRTPVRPGQHITLQRGQKKTQFRVIWTRQLTPSEIQAGIESLEFGKQIWDLELPQQAAAGSGSATENASAPQPSTPEPAPAHKVRPAGPPPLRARWILGFAMLVVAGLLGMFVLHQFLSRSSKVTVDVPTPNPPTMGELASMTPMPARLIPSASADTVSAARLRVAEAPRGHVAYPAAPDASMKGKVNLKVVIGTDGSVKRVFLLSGEQLLAQAAEPAVKQWRYSQHQRDGQPVEAETSVSVSFLGNDAVSLRFPRETGNTVSIN